MRIGAVASRLSQRLWQGMAAILMALLMAGCAGMLDSEPMAPLATTAVTSTDGRHELQTGDTLKIVVFGRDDLSGDYTLDGNGIITLPQAGDFRAGGMTLAAFEAKLVERLQSGIVDQPRVSVLLDTAKPAAGGSKPLRGKPVYVIGEVNKPGEYSVTAAVDVPSAIALAGGYTDRAARDFIYHTRAGSTGERSYKIAEAPRLGPGDVIRVPDQQ